MSGGSCYRCNDLQHLVTRDPTQTTVGATEAEVSRGDGATHSVVIAAAFAAAATAADHVNVGVRMGAVLMPLAVLSQAAPTVVLHRSDIGNAITLNLRAIGTVADTVVTVWRAVSGAGEII